MDLFLNLVASGLVIGSIYGIIAIAFAIIFKTTGVLNFAQGEVMMLVAYTSWSLATSLALPFWLLVANKVGRFVLNVDAVTVGFANDELASGRWAFAIDAFQVAGVTAFGFVVLSVVSAALGYLLSSVIWRLIVARKRARRLRQMEARLDRRLEAGER